MASACINNNITLLQEKNFFECPSSSSYPSYDWFNPRESKNNAEGNDAENPPVNMNSGVSAMDTIGDFEFRLEEDPVTMLPADELFSDGKLVPLQMATVPHLTVISDEIRSLDLAASNRIGKAFASDRSIFSPKAPRCSSGWKEILGLKKLQNPKHDDLKRTTSSSPSKNTNPSSLKNYFLHRNHKSSSSSSSSNDSSLSLPLLRDSNSEPVNASDLSSSSSSSSTAAAASAASDQDQRQLIEPPKVRLVQSVRRVPDSANSERVISVDSPRMNSSGKVVFQNLERSSSSPSSFNGGTTRIVKHKGMERSYSANVRVTPILNVPLCSSLRGSSSKSSSGSSVFGFGQLFSSSPTTSKREGGTIIRKKPN